MGIRSIAQASEPAGNFAATGRSAEAIPAERCGHWLGGGMLIFWFSTTVRPWPRCSMAICATRENVRRKGGPPGGRSGGSAPHSRDPVRDPWKTFWLCRLGPSLPATTGSSRCWVRAASASPISPRRFRSTARSRSRSTSRATSPFGAPPSAFAPSPRRPRRTTDGASTASSRKPRPSPSSITRTSLASTAISASATPATWCCTSKRD